MKDFQNFGFGFENVSSHNIKVTMQCIGEYSVDMIVYVSLH